MPSRRGSKTSGKSGRKGGGNTTAAEFGICAVLVRVLLAVLVVIRKFIKHKIVYYTLLIFVLSYNSYYHLPV